MSIKAHVFSSLFWRATGCSGTKVKPENIKFLSDYKCWSLIINSRRATVGLTGGPRAGTRSQPLFSQQSFLSYLNLYRPGRLTRIWRTQNLAESSIILLTQHNGFTTMLNTDTFKEHFFHSHLNIWVRNFVPFFRFTFYYVPSILYAPLIQYKLKLFQLFVKIKIHVSFATGLYANFAFHSKFFSSNSFNFFEMSAVPIVHTFKCTSWYFLHQFSPCTYYWPNMHLYIRYYA